MRQKRWQRHGIMGGVCVLNWGLSYWCDSVAFRVRGGFNPHYPSSRDSRTDDWGWCSGPFYTMSERNTIWARGSTDSRYHLSAYIYKHVYNTHKWPHKTMWHTHTWWECIKKSLSKASSLPFALLIKSKARALKKRNWKVWGKRFFFQKDVNFRYRDDCLDLESKGYL